MGGLADGVRGMPRAVIQPCIPRNRIGAAMAKRDYYEVLGVTRNASAEEIKRAHRKLAKQYHPDRHRGDKAAEQKFKEVQEAYDVLNDKRKRALYDQFGHEASDGRWSTSGTSGYTRATGPGGVEVNIGDLEDLFSIFGGGRAAGAGPGGIFDQFTRGGGAQGRGRRHPHSVPGEDLEHEARLSFDQAVHGTTLDFELTRPSGSAEKPQRLSVRIPPGVEDGQRIRVRGKGHPGQNGAAAGDLYIICRVGDHPYFRREGADIYLDVPVTISEAALGATIEIPTVQGPTRMRIPPGTPSGRKLRLRGRGLTRSKGEGHGDHYAVIQIVPPKEPNERQRELLESLAEAGDDDPRRATPWASEAAPAENA